MNIKKLIESSTNPLVKYKLQQGKSHTNESMTKMLSKIIGKKIVIKADDFSEAEATVKFTKAKKG